ncbi:hypothetical protein [Orrella marina]|uniref:Uncharacterized protein n=1 Tax=Orrella marina TaxID=2163011 RepID=A0A2R4XFX3_9BURK|nr:hypothetical protein [Orrella marina]AWB32694.1 hypothetical protein DBV39_02045 [Orrella marina]
MEREAPRQSQSERLLEGLTAQRYALDLLETIPGVDRIGAAMLIVEIGTEMQALPLIQASECAHVI